MKLRMLKVMTFWVKLQKPQISRSRSIQGHCDTQVRSLLTGKAERSTRTYVGIIRKTAWQSKMFSIQRWWICESLNTFVFCFSFMMIQDRETTQIGMVALTVCAWTLTSSRC